MTFTTAAALVDCQIPTAALPTKLFVMEQLVSGKRCLCPDCRFLAESDSVCDVCMVNAYEAKMANAECGEYGMDAYAEF